MNEQRQQLLDVLDTIIEAQATGLYADCQDGALQIVDYIENNFGSDGADTVALLIEYCEMLYNASNGEESLENLVQQCQRIQESVKYELNTTDAEENVTSEQIKLVIWDLDETFWSGTLAEDGHVTILQNSVSIVKSLTQRGIINSICSKNDFDAARLVLQEAQIWDYFVFPCIAFTPKGEAIKRIIEDMQLRAPNVLFVDDNHANLEEARFYNPGIQTLPAKELDSLLLLPGAAGSPDLKHQRLEQYKMLEKRYIARQSTDDNKEFLRSSDIHIMITPTTPEDAERVHDMIMRTNQLNFTKKRISLDEVVELLKDPSADSATIRVYDRFGDHGVVGWYCLQNTELIHFLFSCRIINLGIEQYIYAYLGYPRLSVIGDTASSVSLSDVVPDYITLDENDTSQPVSVQTGASAIEIKKLQIYALGACDLYYMVGHMALPLTNVHFECNTFNGDTRGVNVATEYIRSCFEMNEQEKNYCRAHFHNYTGSTAFCTKILDGDFDFVCLSFHDDFALDIYQSNEFPQMRVVLSNSKTGSFTPILNPEGHANFNGAAWLDERFTRLGLITPERFRENLEWIEEHLPQKTRLIIMTGPEFDYFRDSEPHNASFREQIIRLNVVIRDFCANSPRAALVEMNEVINKREHFTDFIMHLKPERGYSLAMQMLAAMTATPAHTGLKEALPIGSRNLVLWSEVNSLLPNILTMCASGAAPYDVVVTSSVNVSVPGVNTIIQQDLDRQNNKYYVLLTPGKDIEQRRKELASYGYRADIDYIELTQTPFTLDWRE